jgi:hypothetical protein
MTALAYEFLPEQNYDQTRLQFEELITAMDSQDAFTMSHSELERDLDKKSRELMRVMLEEHIRRRGVGNSQGVIAGNDGTNRTQKRLHERELETLFGTITVERTGYVLKENQSLHPLDASLNLPESRYSLELQRRISIEAAKGSFDETVEFVTNNTSAHVPKRQAEEIVEGSAQDFDAFYEKRQQSVDPDQVSGSVLVLSVDGKGIVMRPQDLRPQTRKAAERRTPKMKQRLSKGEKKNAKRMATVAAVYTIAPFKRSPEDLMSHDPPSAVEKDSVERPKPENKRVWASVEKEPVDVIKEAFEEALRRDPDHGKIWVALVDGNKNQIDLVRRISKEMDIELTIVVDVIHVIEYLWKAGRVFHPESGSELESWVRQRLGEVLQGKAGLVAGGMRRSATKRGISSVARQPVDTCARYLLNHKHYLRFNDYLDQGLPIATGIIEGACRHLVKDRMDVTGARWSLSGAEAVLRLRALRSSNDFEEYWTYHEQCEYERNHKARYKDGKVPAITFPPHLTKKKAHLRVIK